MHEDKTYLEDICFMQQNFSSQEEIIKRWPFIDRDKYELPLIRLLSFLRSPERERLAIRPISCDQNILDIISHSRLARILEYDAASAFVRFRADLPLTLREEIVSLIRTNDSEGIY